MKTKLNLIMATLGLFALTALSGAWLLRADLTGYVDLEDAAQLGISPAEFEAMANEGSLNLYVERSAVFIVPCIKDGKTKWFTRPRTTNGTLSYYPWYGQDGDFRGVKFSDLNGKVTGENHCPASYLYDHNYTTQITESEGFLWVNGIPLPAEDRVTP